MITPFWIWILVCIVLTHGRDVIVKQEKAIEILVSTVRSNDMERYLTLDNEIWTSFLKTQDGFIGKQSLLSTHESVKNATEVYHIIEWASYIQWKNISKETLIIIDKQFVQAFGYAPEMKSLPDDDGFQIVGPKSTQ
jgi:uncharacterized protein (TIGR03792 family)